MRRSNLRLATLLLCLGGGVAAAKRPVAPPSPAGTTAQLLDRLAVGLPPAEAVAALDALAAARDPAALVVLGRYARHLDPTLRAHAVTALAVLDGGGPACRAALGDVDAGVRARAAAAVAARKDRAAIPALLALVGHGDEGAAVPLAALADADVARQVAELAGQAPDRVVALTLGAMLLRPDLGPDSVHVGVVRALGSIPGPDALAALRGFVDAASKVGAARPSVREARALYEQRAGTR